MQRLVRLMDRKLSGASLTEAVVGLIFLIPLVLILIDVTSLVIAQTTNDGLAKHAARQAAGAGPMGNAASTAAAVGQRNSAAAAVVSAYHDTSMCSNARLVNYAELNGNSIVQVTTQLTCNLPVPVPFGGPSNQVFVAQASEPITTASAVNVGGSATGPSTGTGGYAQGSDLGYLNVALPTGPGGSYQIGPSLPSGGGSSSSSSSTSGTSTSTTGGGGGGGGGCGGCCGMCMRAVLK